MTTKVHDTRLFSMAKKKNFKNTLKEVGLPL